MRNPQSGEVELSIEVFPRPEFKNYFSIECNFAVAVIASPIQPRILL